MKKSCFLFAFCILCSATLSSQNMASTLDKDKEFIVTVGPTASQLVNSNLDKDEYKVVDKQNGFNFNFSYNKYFKNRIGISVGLGFSNYKQVVYQKGLFSRSNQTDKDGNNYELLMNSDMSYISNLNYLDIPITLHLLLGNSSHYYGFINLGLVNGFLIEGTYTKKGSIENIGKYPTSNSYFSTISQNNPYYNYAFQGFSKENPDAFKSYNFSLKFSIGIAVAMTNRLTLRIAPELTKGFSDITAKVDQGKDYVNVFGDKSGYQPIKTFSLGLNIGFGFNL